MRGNQYEDKVDGREREQRTQLNSQGKKVRKDVQGKSPYLSVVASTETSVTAIGKCDFSSWRSTVRSGGGVAIVAVADATKS